MLTWNPRVQELVAKGVQDLPKIDGKFQASLGYMRPSFIKKNKVSLKKRLIIGPFTDGNLFCLGFSICTKQNFVNLTPRILGKVLVRKDYAMVPEEKPFHQPRLQSATVVAGIRNH